MDALSGTAGRSLEAVWSEQHLSATSYFFRVRPLVVIPAACIACVVWVAAGVGRMQLVAVCLTSGALAMISLREASRTRQKGLAQRTISARAWLGCLLPALGAMVLLCAASGGIESPFLPLLVVPTAVTFAVFGKGRASDVALLVATLSVVALYAIALVFPQPAIPLAYRGALTAVSALCVFVLLKVEVTSVVEASRATAQELDRMRLQTQADAELRSRTLDSVGAKVAHEIKNPLSAISGLAQLLSVEGDGPRARRRFEVMLQEIRRIDGILQDYLHFSRPLSEMQVSPVDLRKLAEEVASVLEGTAGNRGVAIECAGPSVLALVDPRLVKQALLNLVKNALEATPAGKGVRVLVKEREKGVELEVQDTGCGMDTATLTRVGGAFFTGCETGTGLGVLLARTVARQHDGDLDFESAPGLGTRAHLTLCSQPGAP